MKYLVTILTILLLSACGENKDQMQENEISDISHQVKAKGTDIPEAVLNRFNKRFPSVKSAKWDNENENFEAEFMMDSKEYEAEFTKTGEWLSTEYKTVLDSIPEKAIKAVMDTYSGYNTGEVEIVESKEFGSMYEIEIERKIENGKEVLIIYVDRNGNILKIEQEEDERKESGKDDEEKE